MTLSHHPGMISHATLVNTHHHPCRRIRRCPPRPTPYQIHISHMDHSRHRRCPTSSSCPSPSNIAIYRQGTLPLHGITPYRSPKAALNSPALLALLTLLEPHVKDSSSAGQSCRPLGILLLQRTAFLQIVEQGQRSREHVDITTALLLCPMHVLQHA